MNNIVADKLKLLIEEHGTELCEDPKLCRGFLMDLCGDFEKEINTICFAVECSIPREFLTKSRTPYRLKRARFIQKLTDKYPISKDVAKWCIEAWANALKEEEVRDIPCDGGDMPGPEESDDFMSGWLSEDEYRL